MDSLAQRAGDQATGGVMTGLEDIWNGPGNCSPKATG